jgi:hypothetical protein
MSAAGAAGDMMQTGNMGIMFAGMPAMQGIPSVNILLNREKIKREEAQSSTGSRGKRD